MISTEIYEVINFPEQKFVLYRFGRGQTQKATAIVLVEPEAKERQFHEIWHGAFFISAVT